MAIELIGDRETGASLREKLNALITKVNGMSSSEDYGKSAVEDFQKDLTEIKSKILSISAKNSLIVKGELIGEQNGVNHIFLTSIAFVAGSTRFYRNGLLQSINKDYTENDGQKGITILFEAPGVDEILVIEYIPFE